MIEITRPRIFTTQVCSDEPLTTVIKWMNEREVSSAEWELASTELMAAYGSGDPNPIECEEKPGFCHYLLVVKGWYDDL